MLTFARGLWLLLLTVLANGRPKCPEQDGVFPTYFPHESDCKKFYECSNGIAYVFDCPINLHFNPILNVCDWPWKAGCLEGICPEVDGARPVYIPHHECTKFYECSNGVPYVFDCPNSLHFNPTLNICDYAERAGCRG